MKKLLAVLIFMAALAAQATDRVTATITVTNAPTVNGNTLVVNGDTRTWTNLVVNPGSEVLTNATIGGSATNLWLHTVAAPFAGPVNAGFNSTNVILLRGAIGQTMAVSQVGDWCSITYSTQTVSTLQAVRVPMASEQATVRTNIATLLVTGIGAYAQNNFDAAAIPFTNFVNTTAAQTIAGAKSFIGPTYIGGAHLTNGANYGLAFSSPGSAANSEQFGDGATASGTASTALGVISTASGYNSTAIGANSTASGRYSITIGGLASQTNSIAIGLGSVSAGAGSIALGNNAVVGAYTNSMAIGGSSANTADNEIMLGSALHTVKTAGIISGPTITNATYHGTIGLLAGGYLNGASGTNTTLTNTISKGTFNFTGDLALQRANHTSMANSNNADIDFGTGSFAKIKAGPTGAFAICGIAGARNGRLLVLYNATGQDMTIAHESGVEATATNRVVTMTGADVTGTGNSSAILFYDTDATRWVLISTSP